MHICIIYRVMLDNLTRYNYHGGRDMHRNTTQRRVVRGGRRHRSMTGSVLVAAGVLGLLGSSAGVAGAEAVNWDALAWCESRGNWHANTGNGFYGGLQFKESTWREFGGIGSPADASRDEQIAVAYRVLAVQGPKAWPTCGPRAIPDIAVWQPIRDVIQAIQKAMPH